MPILLKLLIVEDSEDDARLLAREFVRSGYELVWERVESEPEMRAALERREWDLVVSDYSLPLFSAPGALAVMKGMGLDLPFIVVSGKVGEEVAVETMKSGAHDFFLKGSLARLVPAIERELENAAQRRESRAVVEANARLAAIVECSSDAIIGRSLDGTVTAWNAGAERMYGYSAEQVIGRPMSLHVPAGAGEVARNLGRIQHGEFIDDFETVRVRKDGSQIDVSMTLSPIRNSSGEMIGVSTIARDITLRKRAEESIQKLGRAVEQAKNAILMTDPDGKITYANPAFEEIYGYSVQEALGKTPRILKSGRYNQAFYERFWQKLLAGESVRQEFVNKTRDGQFVTVESSVGPVLDEHGRRIGFIAVQDDITERKRADERVLQLNRLLRTISEINQAIVRTEDREMLRSEACRILVDHGGFLMVWLGLADAASGLVVPAAQAGERTDYLRGLLVRFDDSPEGRGPVGTAIRTGKHAVIGDVATDPSVAPWRERMLACGFRTIAAFPLRLHGTVTGALTVYASKAIDIGDEETALLDELARDLSYALESLDNRDERKNAEEALAKSELYHRSLVEHSLDIVAVIAPGGELRYASPSGKRILGYSTADLSGLNAFDLIHPDDRSLAEGKFRRSLETGTKFEQIELRVRHRDGSWRTLSFIGRPLPPETGMQGLIINARDLTEHQQLEAQLRVSQKMEGIGRLAGGIAHDFNNLLTAILGYSELMEARLPDDEDLRSSLHEIRLAGERAAGLTRQLLAFSRRQVLQPKLLDLNSVVSEVEKLLRRLIGEDVKLMTTLDPGLGSVKADPGQLEQVLMNLAVNARDAMPEGGTLTIETTNAVLDARFAAGHPGARSGEYAALTVTDTGVGMSEDVRSHAFEPFFTTKERGKGTGLGLATAYGIVKQSDGYITVESEPGRGTTFRIYFPRAAGAAEASGLGERPALSPRGAETILLVEDEPGVRRLSRAILEAQGYTVLEAASGDEALEVARSHAGRIHLVATDVIMPGMSGRVLWDRLRPLRPASHILFMSGYTDDTIARHGVLEPGIAFLQKPFTPHSLADKVREVLDRP